MGESRVAGPGGRWVIMLDDARESKTYHAGAGGLMKERPEGWGRHEQAAAPAERRVVGWWLYKQAFAALQRSRS